VVTPLESLKDKYLKDPDIIPPEGQDKEKLAEALAQQQIRQRKNNDRAFELLTKAGSGEIADPGGGSKEGGSAAMYRLTEFVQKPVEKNENLKRKVWGEPTKKHLKIMNRPLKVLDLEEVNKISLDAFPTDDSDEHKTEIQQLKEYRKLLDDEAVRDRIEKQDGDLLFPFNRYLRDNDLEIDTEEFAKVLKDVNTIIFKFKFFFNRPRPHQYSDLVEIDNVGGKSPSYPSGHSTTGAVIAELLSDKFPEHAENFKVIGTELGYNRIISGLHHISDHIGGLKLASQLLPLLIDIKITKSDAFMDELFKYMAHRESLIKDMTQIGTQDILDGVRIDKEDQALIDEDFEPVEKHTEEHHTVEHTAEEKPFSMDDAKQDLKDQIQQIKNKIETGDYQIEKFLTKADKKPEIPKSGKARKEAYEQIARDMFGEDVVISELEPEQGIELDTRSMEEIGVRPIRQYDTSGNEIAFKFKTEKQIENDQKKIDAQTSANLARRQEETKKREQIPITEESSRQQADANTLTSTPPPNLIGSASDQVTEAYSAKRKGTITDREKIQLQLLSAKVDEASNDIDRLKLLSDLRNEFNNTKTLNSKSLDNIVDKFSGSSIPTPAQQEQPKFVREKPVEYTKEIHDFLNNLRNDLQNVDEFDPTYEGLATPGATRDKVNTFINPDKYSDEVKELLGYNPETGDVDVASLQIPPDQLRDLYNVQGARDKEDIKEQIEKIKSQIEKTTSNSNRKQLEERMKKLDKELGKDSVIKQEYLNPRILPRSEAVERVKKPVLTNQDLINITRAMELHSEDVKKQTNVSKFDLKSYLSPQVLGKVEWNKKLNSETGKKETDPAKEHPYQELFSSDAFTPSERETIATALTEAHSKKLNHEKANFRGLGAKELEKIFKDTKFSENDKNGIGKTKLKAAEIKTGSTLDKFEVPDKFNTTEEQAQHTLDVIYNHLEDETDAVSKPDGPAGKLYNQLEIPIFYSALNDPNTGAVAKVRIQNLLVTPKDDKEAMLELLGGGDVAQVGSALNAYAKSVGLMPSETERFLNRHVQGEKSVDKYINAAFKLQEHIANGEEFWGSGDKNYISKLQPIVQELKNVDKSFNTTEKETSKGQRKTTNKNYISSEIEGQNEPSTIEAKTPDTSKTTIPVNDSTQSEQPKPKAEEAEQPKTDNITDPLQNARDDIRAITERLVAETDPNLTLEELDAQVAASIKRGDYGDVSNLPENVKKLLDDMENQNFADIPKPSTPTKEEVQDAPKEETTTSEPEILGGFQEYSGLQHVVVKLRDGTKQHFGQETRGGSFEPLKGFYTKDVEGNDRTHQANAYYKQNRAESEKLRDTGIELDRLLNEARLPNDVTKKANDLFDFKNNAQEATNFNDKLDEIAGETIIPQATKDVINNEAVLGQSETFKEEPVVEQPVAEESVVEQEPVVEQPTATPEPTPTPEPVVQQPTPVVEQPTQQEPIDERQAIINQANESGLLDHYHQEIKGYAPDNAYHSKEATVAKLLDKFKTPADLGEELGIADSKFIAFKAKQEADAQKLVDETTAQQQAAEAQAQAPNPQEIAQDLASEVSEMPSLFQTDKQGNIVPTPTANNANMSDRYRRLRKLFNLHGGVEEIEQGLQEAVGAELNKINPAIKQKVDRDIQGLTDNLPVGIKRKLADEHSRPDYHEDSHKAEVTANRQKSAAQEAVHKAEMEKTHKNRLDDDLFQGDAHKKHQELKDHNEEAEGKFQEELKEKYGNSDSPDFKDGGHQASDEARERRERGLPPIDKAPPTNKAGTPYLWHAGSHHWVTPEYMKLHPDIGAGTVKGDVITNLENIKDSNGDQAFIAGNRAAQNNGIAAIKANGEQGLNGSDLILTNKKASKNEHGHIDYSNVDYHADDEGAEHAGKKNHYVEKHLEEGKDRIKTDSKTGRNLTSDVGNTALQRYGARLKEAGGFTGALERFRAAVLPKGLGGGLTSEQAEQYSSSSFRDDD